MSLNTPEVVNGSRIERTERVVEADAYPPPPPQPPTASAAGPGRRWAIALALTVIGGLSWFIFAWGVASGAPLIVIAAAILPALTCLAAGWLLRSWWGLAAASVVYVAASALMWFLAAVGVGDWQAWLVTFPLSVVLPGVVMAAIGTAIGMYRARRA